MHAEQAEHGGGENEKSDEGPSAVGVHARPPLKSNSLRLKALANPATLFNSGLILAKVRMTCDAA
jgi:hypothetical protein